MRFREQNVRAPDENACTAGYNNVGFVCTALPTFFGPRTRITHGLQSLMGCILSTIHCRSQRCWELLHCLHTTTIPDATTARKELHINNDLEVVHPLSGYSSTWFLVELEFENVGFIEEEKTGVLGVQERKNNKLNQHGVDAGIKCQRSTKRKNKIYKHSKEMLKGRREVCTLSKKVRTPVQQQSARKWGNFREETNIPPLSPPFKVGVFFVLSYR